jgi:polyisoprenoid-binding protein YceI
MADMAIATRTRLPTGTWQVDPAHSRIGFAAKHLGIATVRGFFREFEGTLDVDAGRACGTVKAASLDTNLDMRDEHLRSSDFFEVAEHPELRFESTEIRPLDEDTFTFNQVLGSGNMLVSDRVKLQLDISAVKQG